MNYFEILAVEERVSYVVINENILGYINSRQPSIIGVLHASILRGATFPNGHGGLMRPMNDKGMRPATRQDFDDYRCSTVGYENDPRCDFPKE